MRTVVSTQAKCFRRLPLSNFFPLLHPTCPKPPRNPNLQGAGACPSYHKFSSGSNGKSQRESPFPTSCESHTPWNLPGRKGLHTLLGKVLFISENRQEHLQDGGSTQGDPTSHWGPFLLYSGPDSADIAVAGFLSLNNTV